MAISELAEYVVDYYGRFLTTTEKEAFRHAHWQAKVDLSRQRDSSRVADYIERRLMSDDPEVITLAEQGLEALYEHLSDRILRDHGDELEFNRCPKCGGLCRTPLAKQCRHCFHDWH